MLLLCSACAFLVVPPAIAAAQVPEVGYLTASNVSTTGATIEASINPEGVEAGYEIQLECQSPQQDNQTCEPLTVDPQRREGVLTPGVEPKVVTDAVTGLQPGYLYKYAVIATNSTGREGFVGAGFLTCPSQGSCPSQPYLPGQSVWVMEGARRSAEEAPRLEAERVARKREAEERLAKEAAERNAPACVVPRLRGYSPADARRALRRAHCSLGKLTGPRRHRGQLVVVGQSVPGGSALAAGSAVALKLGHGGKR